MALEKLESFEFVWEAELIRGLLESEGIQAFVFDAEHIRLNWALSNALGGVRVMVHAIDFDKANTVLTNWRAGLYEQQEDFEQESNMDGDADQSFSSHCNSCGSEEIKPIYNSIKTLLFFLLVGPAPGKRIGYSCKKCNYKEIYD